MTKEFYEKLVPYEKAFRYAVKSNFISMSAGEFNAIAYLYEEYFKEALTKSQSSCNTCRLRAVKKLGEEYFKKKEEIEAREKKKQEKDNNKGEETKKVGRPPKIDLNAE